MLLSSQLWAHVETKVVNSALRQGRVAEDDAVPPEIVADMAARGFFGSAPFSIFIGWLVSQGQEPIVWA